MNRLLLIGLFFLLVLGCKNKNEILEKELLDNLSHYMNESIKESGDDIIVEGITVLRIDTVTAKIDSISNHYALLNLVERMTKAYTNHHEQTKIKINQARLWKSMDNEMFEIASKDAQEYLDKGQKNIENLNMISAKADNIFSKIKNGSIDSIQPTGYLVVFNVKARDSKNVAQDKDSLSLIFDLDKRIKKSEYDDLLETPY